MNKIKDASHNILQTSFSLASVLWWGITSLKIYFLFLAALSVIVYSMDYLSPSVSLVAVVMAAPLLTQILLGICVVVRTCQFRAQRNFLAVNLSARAS